MAEVGEVIDSFADTQVQPFNLGTPDNETLYGWHLMPLHLCYEHEEELSKDPPSGPAADYTQTSAFKLLANDPNARVVVFCMFSATNHLNCSNTLTLINLAVHGNAAHLGSASRPQIYSSMLALSTPSNPVHVFALDYRGFGISTGSPTEEGVITDGVTLLNFLTAGPYNIRPSQIVIAGQSLGTAVTAAVAERFAFGSPDETATQPAIKNAEPFAGVLLLASFSNLPNLIQSYSIKGLTPPLLSPLIGYPRFKKWIIGHTVDYWDTAARVARLTGIQSVNPDASSFQYTSKDLDLTIVHALNDFEIPWYEGRRVWIAATGEEVKDAPGALVHEEIEDGRSREVKVWENKITGEKGKEVLKRVRWERVLYGGMSIQYPQEAMNHRTNSVIGHNNVAQFSIAGMAVMRAFET